MGVKSGIVTSSADLTAWGLQPDGQPWTIGMVHPKVASDVISDINVTDLAVTVLEIMKSLPLLKEVFPLDYSKNRITGIRYQKRYHHYPPLAVC